MKILFFLSIISLVKALTYSVNTVTDFKNALNNVAPGDVISLADGTYSGIFKLLRSGTSLKPITLTGTKRAILTSTSYCLHIQANWWVVRGFSVANCKKAIILDQSNNNILDSLSIHHIEDEAVHFRYNSSSNTIKNSDISYTGLINAGAGEGVYIGSSLSHWINNVPDLSGKNKVINNRFGPGIAAEAVDIKEGSESNLIDNNLFNGIGMSGQNYADSWVDVKGAKNTISNNKGIKSLLDGFQVHKVQNSVANSGCDNTFTNNTCSNLGSGGVCVSLYKGCTNLSINNIVA